MGWPVNQGHTGQAQAYQQTGVRACHRITARAWPVWLPSFFQGTASIGQYRKYRNPVSAGFSVFGNVVFCKHDIQRMDVERQLFSNSDVPTEGTLNRKPPRLNHIALPWCRLRHARCPRDDVRVRAGNSESGPFRCRRRAMQPGPRMPLQRSGCADAGNGCAGSGLME